MTMIAYAFLQARRLKQAAGGKKNRRTTAPADPAGDPSGHSHSLGPAAADTLSALP
jgi:hypothetical protein